MCWYTNINSKLLSSSFKSVFVKESGKINNKIDIVLNNLKNIFWLVLLNIIFYIFYDNII